MRRTFVIAALVLLPSVAAAQKPPAKEQRIPVVVIAGDPNGLKDPAREESKGDLTKKLAESKWVRLVPADQAVVTVDVLRRTDAYSQRTVIAQVTAAGQSTELTGRVGMWSGKHFSGAANDLAKRIDEWVMTNFDKLRQLTK